MCAGDRQAIVDDDLSPASVEIESDDVFAICRSHRLAEVFVERVNLVRKHLSVSAGSHHTVDFDYLVVAAFSPSYSST